VLDPGDRRLSALPSVRARILAFVAIIVAGAAGGLIGWSFVHVGCDGDCGVAAGFGALVGAVTAAGGVAVVAVLTLRAMGEWRRIQQDADGDVA
jgi:hydrogenase maturation factor HypE